MTIPLLYEEGDIPGRRSGLNYLKRAIGENKSELYDFSPVFHAAKLKDTPVFLIHGEEDPRAPIEHAYRMEKALKDVNHPVLETSISRRKVTGFTMLARERGCMTPFWAFGSAHRKHRW